MIAIRGEVAGTERNIKGSSPKHEMEFKLSLENYAPPLK
jgi:hypothetical protein